MFNIGTAQKNALILVAFVLLILDNGTSFAQNRTTIEWQGRTVDVAQDQIVLKLKAGVSAQVLDDRMQSVDLTILAGPDDMQLVRAHIAKAYSVVDAIQIARAIDVVEDAGPIMSTHVSVTPNDPSYNNQWGPKKIRAAAAWDITTGTSSVILAILDSGIPIQSNSLSHPDLQNSSRILLGEDQTGDGQGVRDRNGHGTHVAGIASAETDNSTGVAGMSWNTKLFIVQVFDSTGNGYDYMVYDGVRNAVDNGAKVINYSGGQMAPSFYAEAAVQYARNNGRLLVAAAGNYNQDRNPNRIVEWPAAYSLSYDNVIAVSATNASDVIADFSSRGPAVNLAAPGEGIYSTLPNYQVRLNLAPHYRSQNYDNLNGTSMATPHVAGSVDAVGKLFAHATASTHDTSTKRGRPRLSRF